MRDDAMWRDTMRRDTTLRGKAKNADGRTGEGKKRSIQIVTYSVRNAIINQAKKTVRPWRVRRRREERVEPREKSNCTMFQRWNTRRGGGADTREVAAACRQAIWREKRIRTRRWGMSERSNTSRSSVSRDHGGEKNAVEVEKGKNERKDPWVLAGCSRDLRLSARVPFAFFSVVLTLFPLLRFF